MPNDIINQATKAVAERTGAQPSRDDYNPFVDFQFIKEMTARDCRKIGGDILECASKVEGGDLDAAESLIDMLCEMAEMLHIRLAYRTERKGKTLFEVETVTS